MIIRKRRYIDSAVACGSTLISDSACRSWRRLVYRWPANIREPQNFIERAAVMTTGRVLRPDTANFWTEDSVSPTVRTPEYAGRAHITPPGMQSSVNVRPAQLYERQAFGQASMKSICQ